jgi:hypothetical protein
MLLQIDGGGAVDFFKARPPSGRGCDRKKVPVISSRNNLIFDHPVTY